MEQNLEASVLARILTSDEAAAAGRKRLALRFFLSWESVTEILLAQGHEACIVD